MTMKNQTNPRVGSGRIHDPYRYLLGCGYSHQELKGLAPNELRAVAALYRQMPDRKGYRGEISTPAGSGKDR